MQKENLYLQRRHNNGMMDGEPLAEPTRPS
jgi:hypothetical protein